MLKDGYVITFDLLLDLQDMNICWELFDLTTTNGIDQARLTDTVSSHKTVLSSLDKPQMSVLQKSLATNDDVDGSHVDVLLESFAFVVAALRHRDTLLMAHELLNLLVQCVFGSSSRFIGLKHDFTSLELTVLVSLASVDTSEWVQEVFIPHNIALLLHLVQDDRVRQLFSHDRVSLLNNDKLFVKKDLGSHFANFVGSVFSVDHAICEEISYEREELGRIPWRILFDQLGHVLIGLVRQSCALNLRLAQSLNSLKLLCRCRWRV